MAMKKKRGNWKFEYLEKATEEVREGKLSVRAAERKYAIHQSTIHDHASLKVTKVSRPGPPPVLGIEVEKQVDWINAGVG